jgi:pimeloyl-ACP methyl ester carboxylesterase
MRADDADRKNARAKFLDAMRSVYRLDRLERHAIPYGDGDVEGFLPAYRFTPTQSKGTIVFFGGFDSYIEELTSAFFYLRDARYEVIAFEGPGQGGALNDAGLRMAAEWHKPVKAVLDFFKLDRVTLAGLSMGGCLVFRAAAFERRVERVVAYDIYPDSLDVNLRQVSPLLRGLLKVLLELRAAAVVNVMAKRVAKRKVL